MTLQIVVTDYDFPNLSIEKSVVSDADVDIVGAHASTPEEVIDVAKEADGLLVQYAPITEEVIDAIDVAAIGRYGIGVDNVDLDAASYHSVQVVNVPDYCTEEVPTHALSLLLTCVRNTARYDHEVKAGSWDWTNGSPIDRVVGSTLGLVGFGKLPRRLVTLAEGFDFNVLVYDPYVDEAQVEAAGCEKVTFEGLLERSRFVSVHAPLTDETYEMFDAETFEIMRTDAFIVNTARGEIIDMNALEVAIENEQIAGAGIDVLPKEPPHPTPPFDHPNIVFTPHVAWYSEESLEEMRSKTTEDVLGIIRGEPAKNPVNSLENT